MLKLVIGDKNLSSWSLRPWLVLKYFEIPFQEIQILLDQPQTKNNIAKYSPSGKVPLLINGQNRIWDSLAICEYIHELHPEKNVWPKEGYLRALARSYAAQMHSGFFGLRNQLSMNVQLRTKITHLDSQTIEDIRTIVSLWDQALRKHKGSFLFGDFCVADAFYAPVVLRFISYGVEIRNINAKKYMSNVLKIIELKKWIASAKKEKPVYTKF